MAEELSRKLTMEVRIIIIETVATDLVLVYASCILTISFDASQVSVLKHEKEMLANSERRASDEVRSLSERVHRLQVEC